MKKFIIKKKDSNDKDFLLFNKFRKNRKNNYIDNNENSNKINNNENIDLFQDKILKQIIDENIKLKQDIDIKKSIIQNELNFKLKSKE